MTMIQSLTKSVELPKATMIVLDALRRKRNAADYLGSYIDRATVDAAIAEGEALLARVENWVKQRRPDLLVG